jgi:hypothetical protein
MEGGGTVNAIPLLDCPPTVTTTAPVVAANGTVAVMVVSLQLVTAAKTPLNVTVLLPCVAPKLLPKKVTDVPMIPEAGEMPLRTSGTVKLIPLLATVFEGGVPLITYALPVTAPAGTIATMLLSVQLKMGAKFPLKLTTSLP